MTSPNPTLAAAFQYLETGFSLFPLGYRTKQPDFSLLPKNEAGKAVWQQFSAHRPTPEQLTQWFSTGRHNLALVMGRVSGSVVCIDFDETAAYDEWSKHYPDIATRTAHAVTARGVHVLLKMPMTPVRNWKITIAGQHVGEMRGEGGYIAAWPSIHPGGQRYEWRISPWNKILAVASLAAVGLSAVGAKTSQPGASGTPQPEATPAPPPPNGRYPLPARTLRFMQAGAANGNINTELYHAAIQHAAAGYSEQETVEALLPVAQRIYVGTGPGNTAAQALRTIKSGWNGGQGKEPLTWSLGQKHSPGKPGSSPNGNGIEPNNFRSQNGHQNAAPTNGHLSQLGQPGEEPAQNSGRNGNGNGNSHLGQDESQAQLSSSPNKGGELSPRYTLEAGQMVYTTYKKIDDKVIAIKNAIPFSGAVTRKLILFEEDGKQAVTYTVAGQKDGQPYALDVDAADFADGKTLFTRLLNYLPGGPPPISKTMIAHVSTAISALTDQLKIEQTKASPATGWTPDGKAFVMPTGSVGDPSYVCRLDSELMKEFKGFGFRENSPDENREALEALFDLRQVYRPEAVYVLIAHAFLPPLLRWLGTQARYLLHIHAGSGSLKTELAKLLMAFYRLIDDPSPTRTPDDSAITYKWSATPYGAESRAYGLKDCLMLIDDLKPNTITPDVLPRWVAFIQAYVDAQGRKRSKIGGGAAASLPPRAVLLSTGEAIPEAGEASYTARMLLVELDSRPADAPRNTVLDVVRDNKSHLFSGLMRSYIEWLCRFNGANAVETLKHYQAQNIATAHTRLAANYAANSTGGWMFAQFCYNTGLMTQTERDDFHTNHQLAVIRAVGATSAKVQDERYSRKFIAALRDACSTGFARISDTSADRNRVGWQDGEYVYLLNGSLAVVNQWLRNSGEPPIIIPMREIKKQLFEDLFTHSTQARVDRGEYDLQRLDPADNSKPLVAAVHRAKFYGLEISEPEKAP